MTNYNNGFVSMKTHRTSLHDNTSNTNAFARVKINKFTSFGLLALFLGGILTFSSETSLKTFKVVGSNNITDSIENIKYEVIDNSLDDVRFDENPAKRSEEIRKLLGFKVSQWANILKVERKTLYNWKSSPDSKIKSDALDRINVLGDFSKIFREEHNKFFAKMIFGRYLNKDLLVAFTKENLNLQEMIDAYDSVYDDLDGFVVRDDYLS